MPGYNFSKEQMAARISGLTARNILPLWTQCLVSKKTLFQRSLRLNRRRVLLSRFQPELKKTFPLNNPMNHITHRIKDLTGIIFGKITAIEYAGNRVKKGGTKATTWKCLCQCGSTFVVDANNLTRGITRSCGCLRNRSMPMAEFFTYDSESGLIYGFFDKEKPLGYIEKSNGYVRITFGRKKLYAHRLAWQLMTGDVPSMQIDHINGDRTDNRWQNLREASQYENCLNSKKRSDNASGHKGVSWSKSSNKWLGRISVDAKIIHVGLFDRKEDAIDAVMKERESRHGHFANHG